MTPAEILAAPPDEQISLTTLAHRVQVAPSTPWRWATKGKDGKKLPSVLRGSARITTMAAFVKWCEQLTAAADGSPGTEEASAQQTENEEVRATPLVPRANLLSTRLRPLAPVVNTILPPHHVDSNCGNLRTARCVGVGCEVERQQSYGRGIEGITSPTLRPAKRAERVASETFVPPAIQRPHPTRCDDVRCTRTGMGRLEK
jgi:Protein of unknown function (DUF1580)